MRQPDNNQRRYRGGTQTGRESMNKAELIESISGRLGDRKSATAALDAVLSEIQNAVTKGDKVSITGFGVFERRERAARTARNPRTGETVKVKKTVVPAFRPGAGFKELVAVGRVAKATKTAVAAKPATKATATKATATKATATKAAAKTTKATAAKATPVRAAKTTATKAAPAKKAAPTASRRPAATRTTRSR
jgi:DNA-binding protein HU-beta